jgi:hypothetical protein
MHKVVLDSVALFIQDWLDTPILSTFKRRNPSTLASLAVVRERDSVAYKVVKMYVGPAYLECRCRWWHNRTTPISWANGRQVRFDSLSTSLQKLGSNLPIHIKRPSLLHTTTIGLC